MDKEVKISLVSNGEIIHWTVKVESLKEFEKSLEDFLEENTEIVEKKFSLMERMERRLSRIKI